MGRPVKASIATCWCLLALTISACGSTSHHVKSGRSTSSVSQSDNVASGDRGTSERLQSANVVLGEGHSSKGFRVTAPRGEYILYVSAVAPAKADIALDVRNVEGKVLRVLSSTQNQALCRKRESRQFCFVPIPLPSAASGGRLTVVATKRSGPAADMRLTAAFDSSARRNESAGSQVIGRPQSALLSLPRGESSSSYRITAPSPARYAFDVKVTAPASATVGLHIRTWYGDVFSVLSSTNERASCRASGLNDICTLGFPLLPAQRAGVWTVVATKRSGPAARAHVTVTFVKP